MYKDQKCHLCWAQEKRLKIEYVKEIFEKEGYSLISTSYTGTRYKLEVLCPNGHSWNVSLNKFKDRKQRCPECSYLGGSSKLEKELFLAIKKHYPSAKKSKHRHVKIRNRPYIKGIDVYIPELAMGIEFDGTYFHSISGLRRGYPNWPIKDLKNYHEIKDLYFKSKGIDIFHVKEENWLKNKEECLCDALHFLGSR
jgi:hypothetical protein